MKLSLSRFSELCKTLEGVGSEKAAFDTLRRWAMTGRIVIEKNQDTGEETIDDLYLGREAFRARKNEAVADGRIEA